MKPPPTAPITFHRQMPKSGPSITITPPAAEQIRIAARTSDSERLALRIAAERDAQGSIDYRMGFDNARMGDVVLESEGVELVVVREHVELLDGMTLDYVEYEPGDFRFIFINPNDRGEAPEGFGAAP